MEVSNNTGGPCVNQPSDNGNYSDNVPPMNQNGFTSNIGNQPDFSANYVPTYPPAEFIVSKPPREYNGIDKIFAVLAFLLGFLLTKVLINSLIGWGLMATVVCVGITLFNFFYCKKSGMKLTRGTAVAYGVVLLLSVLFVITDNSSVKTIDFWLVAVSNLYLVYTCCQPKNNSIVFNVLKATIISPFSEYGSSLGALFNKTSKSVESKTSGVKKNILPVILGLALSIPVTFVAGTLLMSGDENFQIFYEKFISGIVDWFFDDLFVNLLIFAFSIPIGMYIFSAVYSRVYKQKNADLLGNTLKLSIRIFVASTCNAFLTPLCLLYVLYIFMQISYMFKTIGTISADFNYSDYARDGFFELCAVAVINLAVAACVIFFVKHDKKKLPVSVRGFIAVFSVLTLCLISTAIVKMMMYIDIYGMTPLRVYTSIFMVYMFVLFVVLIIKQVKFKLSFTKIAYILAVFVIIVMSLLPVDGFIANYNINMYEKGKLEWMGIDAMMQLDSSAVKYFLECDPEIAATEVPMSSMYYFNSEEEYNYPIEIYFKRQNGNLNDFDIYTFNLTKYSAYLQAKESGWIE